MPKGPGGEKRPADVNQRAVMVAKIATGEIEDARPTAESEGKNPTAVALGRMGGKARAEAPGKRKRTEIARKAAKAGGELNASLTTSVSGMTSPRNSRTIAIRWPSIFAGTTGSESTKPSARHPPSPLA